MRCRCLRSDWFVGATWLLLFVAVPVAIESVATIYSSRTETVSALCVAVAIQSGDDLQHGNWWSRPIREKLLRVHVVRRMYSP